MSPLLHYPRELPLSNVAEFEAQNTTNLRFLEAVITNLM